MTKPSTVFSVRHVIQVFVVMFVFSFLGLMHHNEWRTDFSSSDLLVKDPVRVADEIVDGVVLSMNDERYNYTKHVLAHLGINVIRKHPPQWQSADLNQSMEAFFGHRRFHNPTNLKVWSNRIAFTDAMTEFSQDPRLDPKRWRIFLEDDVAIIPNITDDFGKQILIKGLQLADADGFVYLGLCGGSCENSTVLEQNVEAAKCEGLCTHAFGFQKRTAAQFLKDMELDTHRLGVRSVLRPFDQYFHGYGMMVKRIWLIGSNLYSPSVEGHRGILFQDRTRFAGTTIGFGQKR